MNGLCKTAVVAFFPLILGLLCSACGEPAQPSSDDPPQTAPAAPQKSVSHLNTLYSDASPLALEFREYERSLEDRPEDLGLIREYACWLADHKHTDEALELVGRLDLTTLGHMDLCGLGFMWRPKYDEAALVDFSITALEHAQQVEMTEEEARDSRRHAKVQFTPALTRRLQRDRILTGLAERYASRGRLDDAKGAYEAYLELPRRDSFGGRTKHVRNYARLLKKLGAPDARRNAMEGKAKNSEDGRDWAELAAYLQGIGETGKAITAWEKAISLTPPTPGDVCADHPKEEYREQLIAMLEKNGMFEHAIDPLKDGLREEKRPFKKREFFKRILEEYTKLGKKAEAREFLLSQLDEYFDLEVMDMVFQIERALAAERGIDDPGNRKLPSFEALLKKTKELPDDQRRNGLEGFYWRFCSSREYMELLEGFPLEEIGMRAMERLIRACHNCERYDRAVYWGEKNLAKVKEVGLPRVGSPQYVAFLAEISENAAWADSLDTSLDYVEKLCQFEPQWFAFAEQLAEAAVAHGKQAALVERLRALAQERSDCWVVWRILAEVYAELNDDENKEACLRQVSLLTNPEEATKREP